MTRSFISRFFSVELKSKSGEMDYKVISIYKTAKEDLILIPSGISEKWGGATVELELYHRLEKGYTAEQLDKIVSQTFAEFNSQNQTMFSNPVH